MALYGLIILSVLFAITHVGMCHGNIRKGFIEKLGEMGFRGVYSLVSFITFGGALAIYIFYRPDSPVLWEAPRLSYLLVYPLTLLAFILLFLLPASPAPSGMAPAKMEARGVLKITRHPMNMGIAAFSLAHLIANGELADVALFGSLFITGFIGAFHQDLRKAGELGDDYRAIQRETSILPFGAIIAGRTWPTREDINIPLLLLAVAAFAAFIIFHGKLFGETPW